jgi:hypothetical protein
MRRRQTVVHGGIPSSGRGFGQHEDNLDLLLQRSTKASSSATGMFEPSARP